MIMAKEEKEKKAKPTRSPEEIEAQKAAKAAKKAEHEAVAKVARDSASSESKKSRSGKDQDDGKPQPFPEGYVPRLYKRYLEQIAPALKSELGVQNAMRVPRITKIVISMGLGRAITEKPRLEAALKELTAIAGQKAQVCRARKSVSNFKLREGMEIGAKVTLRGQRMWEFLDRLINLAIPRVKDFRGLSPKAFDGQGNYNLGLTEQSVFPEVHGDQVNFQQGMAITIVTTAGADTGARALLTHLGMPFRRDEPATRKAG